MVTYQELKNTCELEITFSLKLRAYNLIRISEGDEWKTAFITTIQWAL